MTYIIGRTEYETPFAVIELADGEHPGQEVVRPAVFEHVAHDTREGAQKALDAWREAAIAAGVSTTI